MPPSPAMRHSQGKEHSSEGAHMRGRSFKSALPHKSTMNDDLALFNDMQNRERDSFLLHMDDDIDESIAKLRYISDKKLGIKIPARGESNELLHADGDKNDYDWLLTPPDTPLFSSLDDDEPQNVNLASRGRTRSQPIAISWSSLSERSQRTSRSSASPHRLSPSPRSSSSVGPSRGRPSSVPRSSPPDSQRSATPSRRPFTPPNKPSTRTQRRSTTPKLRRISSGSSGQTSSLTGRGTSPIKANRGNSASPKLRGWQSNLQGFPCDPPPNLRTSQSERPGSYVRGSSPASRNGRKSISPSALRSSSSYSHERDPSYSHERDRFSSYSKGSAVSSGDDDAASLHSATTGIFISPAIKKNGVLVNNSDIAFSKRASRSSYASSAPKISFDSVLKQMDHHKAPQNMFRPLLSSVPSTSFYVGKGSNTHHPMLSRNSSLTTSSNASSDQGASFITNADATDRRRNDLISEWQRPEGQDIEEEEKEEELFIFEKADGTENCDCRMKIQAETEVLEKPSENFDRRINVANSSEVDIYMMGVCTRCGNRFRILDLDRAVDVCEECAEKDDLVSKGESLTSLLAVEDDALQSVNAAVIDGVFKERQMELGVAELNHMSSISEMNVDPEISTIEGKSVQLDTAPNQGLTNVAEHVQHITEKQLSPLCDVNLDQSNSKDRALQSQVNSSEGTGISVLLQRSESTKWPVLQGRLLSATNILCSEPSYARDNTGSTKRTIVSHSSSASSSVDLGSSRQSEARVQRQSSKRRGETDDVKNEPVSAFQARVLSRSEERHNLDSCSEDVGCKIFVEPAYFNQETRQSLGDIESTVTTSASLHTPAVYDQKSFHDDKCFVTDDSGTQMPNVPESNHLIDNSVACYTTECHSSPTCGNEQICSHTDILSDKTDVHEYEHEPDGAVQSSMYEASLITLESKVDSDGPGDCHVESVPSNDSDTDTTSLEMEAPVPSLRSAIVDLAGGVCEDSTVTVEGRHMPRSLTLAEATDTILFCSSIIHDIAYKAATIGMEKELGTSETSHPTVALGISVQAQNNPRISLHKKHTPKSHKFKRRRFENDTNTPAPDTTVDTEVQQVRPANCTAPDKVEHRDCAKPPKLESKCNCAIM